MSAATTLQARRSKAAVMLARMGTQSGIALHVGCCQQLVGHWMRGDRTPNPHWRHILSQIYGIPEGCWDLPVESPLSPVPSLLQRVSQALSPWPEARSRAVAILKRGGIT